ncbi:sigma-54-dependent transcriptional regulator [Kordiimonas marina]|uniref:sigma-54-dependent transcriptional regulator n=1 Tax=Kordiimonas marina TaxID=2872312 RepID=UPI001FF19D58|nr:sigma-54 dependent transcriptional regulator [Kordiimonas marina]MCJ9427948.1 sigma-54 dependent transcriptional regulator [Kordiimonas marina]
MSGRRVLIVEDELTQITLLQGVVQRAGFLVETAMNGPDAVARLNDVKAPTVDVVLLDLVMPGMDGIKVLETVRPRHPALPVVMLTAQSSINTVVDAMRAGANDFIVKPASAERIRSALEAALKTSDLVGEIGPMQASMQGGGFDSLVGTSHGMTRAAALAKKAARSAIPVLIEGESGVGKEVFARAIHQASARKAKPFVAVNCGAIPENLVESILFGHEKGAFTGATEKRIGKFQEADGGTLFLDEVGELPLDVQVKLLRALQEKEIDPVGGRNSIKVDIRIISATNRNLSDRVAEGAFREDLYYRLNVYPITLPPLRDRASDIPALTEHFLKQITAMEDVPRRQITPEALGLLAHYSWPGNIRQLQNALFRAVILSDSDWLTPADFPHLSGTRPDSADTGLQGTVVAMSPVARPGEGDATMLPLEDASGNIQTLATLEAAIIAAALEKYSGRMAEVARRLGIGRSTLYRKVAEYRLDT